MSIPSANIPSAPECQLSKLGTEWSFDVMLKKAQTLSDDELSALEEDLSYYSETGLIGINMSRLLVLLQPENAAAQNAHRKMAIGVPVRTIA